MHGQQNIKLLPTVSKITKPRQHTVSGVLYVLSELGKFATAARDESFSRRQAAEKSGHYLMAVGKPFIKDNLKNITEETSSWL
jgi:hypothetical protein